MKSALLFLLYDAEENEAQAKEDHGYTDQNGAIHEELLRHGINDPVGPGVKDPVVFTGEEDGMEDRKGLVEIQGGQ